MIKPLTSLRFIFAFLVFMSHYLVAGSSLFSEGYIGVSFFFILSGFVLSYSYKDRLLNGSTTKKEFFMARFARIYPLHIACFTVVLLTSSSINWGAGAANITLLQAWIPSSTYYFSFNAPSWSISDEMFFYLMFPLLISFFYRGKLLVQWGVVITILCCYALALFFLRDHAGASHAFVYVNPLSRILDFTIGIGVYQLWQKTKNSIRLSKVLSNTWTATILELSAIALLVVMIIFSFAIPQITRYSCYYWVPMAAIIYIFAASSTTQGGGYVSRLLSLKSAVLLGEISFGFYMIHSMMLKAISQDLALPVYLHFMVVLFITIGLSMMSFYWFETPMNKWIKKLYKLKQNGKKISI